MGKITENTLIPIGLVIVLAGGIFWLSTLYSEVKANTEALGDYVKTTQSIDRRLSRIEGKLGLPVGSENDH